jgi:hypothetical protein
MSDNLPSLTSQRRLVRLGRPEPDPLAQRVADAIAGEKQAEAALQTAKRERIAAMAALAANSPKLEEARRLYWQTKTPVADIAALLGLTTGNLPKQVAEAIGPLVIRWACGHETSVRTRSERQGHWAYQQGCPSCQEAERQARAERRRAAQAAKVREPPGLSVMYLAGDYFNAVCRKHRLGNLDGGWNNAAALAGQIANWRREGTQLDFVQEMMDAFGDEYQDYCIEASAPPWRVFIWNRNELAHIVKKRRSRNGGPTRSEEGDELRD